LLQFVTYKTTLASQINIAGNELYNTLQKVNVQNLQLNEHGVEYFSKSHKKRLFFSIQTSAHILYQSITICKKALDEIVIMDYGAGLGSLYLLAKLIGCKSVIYNDLLDYWKFNAQQLSKHIQIDVDDYIVGDIETTLQVLNQKGITVDIITTRNVIEHIYSLKDFYACIEKYQPNAIIFSSTTANFFNPAMNLQHVMLHKKVEKIYFNQRLNFIHQYNKQLSPSLVSTIAKHTKGYYKENLPEVIEAFVQQKKYPLKKHYYTNTCDVEFGVWAENILPYSLHKQYINQHHYFATVQPGFWDTHYTKTWKNIIGNMFNWCIELHPLFGYIFAPFIYVVAVPKSIKVA
jgi:2-polyprenyl-3-methyl-5-hydroxy-6-metoxy-1,4-benzoquinol methylase